MGGPKGKSEDEEEDFSSVEQPAPRARREKKVQLEDEDAEIEDVGDRVDTSKLSAEDVKLEKIVALPTWREMLLDLVATKKLDPWNIDIEEVATSYLDRIRKLEMMDLRIPANLILAAAILIRFKADALRFEEETQEVVEETFVEEDSGSEVIPVLELKTRIPPRRMVTLDELLLAMEKVFDDQKKREEKASRIEIPTVINIQLPEFNIEQKMNEVYKKVLDRKDSEGLVTFSSLLEEKTALETVLTLLPLLHLVQDRRLSIFQEKFFGEIFIRVKEESGKGAKKDAEEEKDEPEEDVKAFDEDAPAEEEEKPKKSKGIFARKK
ncbi:Segregation and condensation protein A [uncultured archaeon]|nr:Segregation and condensation protein A [uncultured archaeon]